MSVDVGIIEAFPFFKDLTYEELEAFAARLNPVSVQEGEILIHKGTKALRFYVMLTGAFEVSYEAAHTFILDKKGEIMGWSTVVAPFSYQGTVTALKDADLLYLSGNDFFELIQNDNRLGEKIMKKIERIAAKRRAISEGR